MRFFRRPGKPSQRTPCVAARSAGPVSTRAHQQSARVRRRHVPTGGFGLSCFSTLGVWPLTLPARASEPCTLPCTPRKRITTTAPAHRSAHAPADSESVALQRRLLYSEQVRLGPSPVRSPSARAVVSAQAKNVGHIVWVTDAPAAHIQVKVKKIGFAASSRRPVCPSHAHGAPRRVAHCMRPSGRRRRAPTRPPAIAHPPAHPRCSIGAAGVLHRVPRSRSSSRGAAGRLAPPQTHHGESGGGGGRNRRRRWRWRAKREEVTARDEAHSRGTSQ